MKCFANGFRFSSIFSKYEVYFHRLLSELYKHTFSLFFLYVKKVMNYKFVRQDALLGSCVQLLVRDVSNMWCENRVYCTIIMHVYSPYHCIYVNHCASWWIRSFINSISKWGTSWDYQSLSFDFIFSLFFKIFCFIVLVVQTPTNMCRKHFSFGVRFFFLSASFGVRSWEFLLLLS